MRTKRKATPIGRVEQFVKQGCFHEYAKTNYEELFNKNSSDEDFIFTLFSAATAKMGGIYWEPIEKEWLISKLICATHQRCPKSRLKCFFLLKVFLPQILDAVAINNLYLT